MGQRIVRVSNAVLVELLRIDQRRDDRRFWIEGLPADAVIVGVSGDLYFDRDITAFKVESAEFAGPAPGEMIPAIDLTCGVADPDGERGREFL